MLKKLFPLLLILAIAVPAMAPAAAIQEGDATCLATADVDYLQDYYDISFADTVSQEDFMAATVAIVGEAVDYPAEIDVEDFSAAEAVLTLLYFVNVDELAYTYPEDKVEAVLADWSGVPADLDMARRHELAAAIDSGLLEESCNGLDLAAPTSPEMAYYLLNRVLVFTGEYKHFLGYASDADIYNKLMYTWNSFDQVSMPDLQATANELIREGVITGYNIKRTALNADFDPDMAIVYGHSNITHAIQLIGLLRSEDMDAKVMLEPKTSAFLYLAEWGEPSTSPEFQAEALDDGNYIAYAKEYDLAFEFDNADDRNRFDAVIKEYAKKNEEDQPGLILGSWWQPLYSSRVPTEAYIEVKNNVAWGDYFYIQSFSLIENSEAVASAFADAYPEAEVEVVDLWVNEAFHNYLLGEAQ